MWILIVAIIIALVFLYFMLNRERFKIKRILWEWKKGLKEYQETKDFSTLVKFEMQYGVCNYMKFWYPKWNREWIYKTTVLLGKFNWWCDSPSRLNSFEQNEKLIKQRIEILEDILSGKIKTLDKW